MNKCVLCGTVRNCEQFLQRIFQNMQIIGGCFDDYRIILYYDTSHDNTLNKLIDYKQVNPNFEFYENTEELSPYRTYRIAKGRNYCLQYIREKYSNYKYFIMMDVDDVCCYNMNINYLKTCLRKDIFWDGLTFQHPRGFYDDWALAIGPYIVSKDHVDYGGMHIKYINKLIKVAKKYNSLISCYSAFNGFGIYKTAKFLNCFYDGRYRTDYIPKRLLQLNKRVIKKKIKNTKPREDCEHRYFHFQALLKNKARIKISPNCLFF